MCVCVDPEKRDEGTASVPGDGECEERKQLSEARYPTEAPLFSDIKSLVTADGGEQSASLSVAR